MNYRLRSATGSQADVATRISQRAKVGERGFSDNLRLHFEAVARMSPEDQQVVRSLLEGMILKHDAKRFERSAERKARSQRHLRQGPQCGGLFHVRDGYRFAQPILPRYRVNADFGDDYKPLANLFNTGKGTFRPFNAARFLEEINREIPGQYRKPTPSKIIQTYRHHIEHGDRPYFIGWRDNDKRGEQVSDENLAKTERCFGPAYRAMSKRTNQSSCWTHIAAREKAFFAPPANARSDKARGAGLVCHG